MKANKIKLNGEVILDLTLDTATPETVAKGVTFHMADGTLSTGKATMDGASIKEKDVNFYDYDGTLLYSYTVEAAQALIELPPLPEQKGLICQGWNYDLETIKSYNREVDVGATYITDDGKTRLYISIDQEYTTDVTLSFTQTKSYGVTIDWGDGSSTETVSGTGSKTTKPKHTYASAGDYVITLEATNGTFGLGDNGNYNLFGVYPQLPQTPMNFLKRVEIGSNAVLNKRAFLACTSIVHVTIPNGITTIGEWTFHDCYTLKFLVIPNGVTTVAFGQFYQCLSLSKVVFPNSVTEIGSETFDRCYTLSDIVIPDKVTVLSSKMFQSCYALTNVSISGSVTSLGESVFYLSRKLERFVIPDGVTELPAKLFMECPSLTGAVIPKGVTSVAQGVFYNCLSLRVVDFTSHTSVPTLGSTNVFSSVPTDCEIRVPAALYDEWIAATNWSTSSIASRIVAV